MQIHPYVALAGAILFEVTGTSLLQASQQFTRAPQTIAMACCYLVSFYCLSQALKVVPVGIAYAVWSGVGIATISLIGFVVFKQKLDLAALIGVAMIMGGVVVIYGFSKSMGH